MSPTPLAMFLSYFHLMLRMNNCRSVVEANSSLRFCSTSVALFAVFVLTFVDNRSSILCAFPCSKASIYWLTTLSNSAGVGYLLKRVLSVDFWGRCLVGPSCLGLVLVDINATLVLFLDLAT